MSSNEIKTKINTDKLNPGAQRLVQEVIRTADRSPGANQWLAALLERFGPMAETIATHLEASTALAYVRDQIAAGKPGATLEPDVLVEQAHMKAQTRGKEIATERDVAAVILEAAGYDLHSATPTTIPAKLTPTETEKGAPALTQSTAAWQPKAKRPTPSLAHFGRDLTQAAADGKLSALVGREEETALVIETLCRRTKRNPVLVGPAGVGKTAIVEGLARRVVAGDVPALLRNVRIFTLQPSTLIAGAGYGDLEKRMEAIISEASQEGILLFIDEVHAIVGAGGRQGAGDMSSLLKPALARGELACIAATTDDEYRRFVEEDPALERRFQPLRVQELSASQTLQVLQSLRDEFLQTRGVTISEEVLHDILRFADRYMPNRHFPDKAVDLLEQAVAHALAGGQTDVTRADAMLVAHRLVGMPLVGDEWQEQLRARLETEGALLVNRLQVTLSGFDIRPARPNAIILLAGPAAVNGTSLARSVAEILFGSQDRIVTLDFSRYTEAHHVSMLIGSPPGYVGYSEHLPIHEIARIPWCVLLCANIDACHPVVRDVLTQALNAGFLTDAQGKSLYLSDTVTILTTRSSAEPERKVGIRAHGPDHRETERAAAEQLLGAELVRLCDIVSSDAAVGTDNLHRRQEALLADLSKRYGQHGLSIHWNDSLYTWLDAHCHGKDATEEWERLVDTYLSPLLLAHLKNRPESEPISVVVEYKDDNLQITTQLPGTGA